MNDRIFRRAFLERAGLVVGAIVVCVFVGSPVGAPRGAEARATSSAPIYQDPSYTFAERAADLVSRMTPAQRASQLVSSQAPAIASLGIPAYGWWNEALHGVSRESTAASGNAVTLTNTTSYPIDQSMASSFDPDLMYRVASAISDESREVVRSNKLDLDFYSPTMNLQHDPRWGRNDESYGEDPLLETKMVSQFVNGMEGKDESGNLLPAGNGFYKTTTTIKHYAMNNSEVNRRSGSSDADARTLREYYTKAFRGVVQASQPGAVMSSYNSVNGVPTAADPFLIDTLMRQTFGFQGYFTGDCDAVSAGINPQHHWQPAGFPHPVTVIESLGFALGAGEDAECNAGFTNASNYRGPTAASTTAGGTMNAIGMKLTTGTGLHTVNDLDVSATRLFTNRMKLGEFDTDASVPWLVAARSRVPQGTWTNNNANNAVTETTARLALAREAAEKSIVLLKNGTTTRKDGSVGKLLPIHVPATGTFKVDVMGFFANNANFYLGGYSSTQGTAGQAKEVTPYAGIKAAIQAINPSAVVDFNKGFTSTGTNSNTCCTAIDATAVNNAANYDYVIVYTGGDPTSGCAGCGTEDQDRTSILLTGLQNSLINQVAAKNPNTIAYLETIGPDDVTSFEPNVSALLWSSYIGERKGEAVADVLLGNYNPSGRTSGIWYQNVGQIPPITNYAIRPVGPTGRTYMYYNGPLEYPFGFGLSYSTYGFSNLQIDNHSPTADDTVNVNADVTNTSSTDGNEIVELYVNTPNADPSLQRPIKRLEGFQKVFLAAGETKTVSFPVKIADLAFFSNADNRWEVDDGVYGIQISTSSADADIQLQDTINVSGSLTPTPSVLTAKPRMPGDVARGISQRVMFPENVDVDSGLTLSMNDDSLYGWIEPGQSQPFPAGTTFSYSSDRPAVVSVSDGTIHTIANGAATITATATYNGKSASTSFVVRVLSDLDSIAENGKPVAGFQPDIFSYDVMLAPGAPVPVVTATAPSATVAITQAAAVPGTATIAATGPDGLVATYKVNFGFQATSDEFNGNSLDPRWTVVRPNAANLTEGGGALTIKPETGDLVTTTNTAKNLVLEPAPGDFTMTSKLTFSAKPNAATQQGGIIAYQDDDNWLKFDLEATSATNVQLNTSLEDNLNGVQVNQTLNTTSANAIYPANNTIWLRMVKQGSTYSTSYSLDGSTFVPVWTTGATLSNIKAGVLAINRAGTTTSLQVGFDFFHITNPAPAIPPVVSALPVSSVEGSAFSGAVAAVVDQNPLVGSASDLTATINWGDGSSSPGTITGSGSNYTVSGSHTYVEEGSYAVATSVSDVPTGASGSATSTAVVADAPLTAFGTTSTVGAQEGSAFSGAVATFTDGNPVAPLSDFTATIDWGDGTSSTGVVTGGAGTYTVGGTHTYAEFGTYSVGVVVDDAGGSTASAASIIVVTDAPLSATCAAPPIETGPFDGAVANLVDANTLGTVLDFSASIDWGDGTTSSGTLHQTGAGTYTVSGSHTYGSTGPFVVSTTINDVGGNTASTSCTMLVYGFTPGGGAFTIGDKSATGSYVVGANGLSGTITFWGSQWVKENVFSGGDAPDSFKGFVDSPTFTCGTQWSSSPGNSSRPPDPPFPAYMTVIVSSSVTKSGSTISGDVEHLVVVKTSTDGGSSPGSTGTGTVVATIC